MAGKLKEYILQKDYEKNNKNNKIESKQLDLLSFIENEENKDDRRKRIHISRNTRGLGGKNLFEVGENTSLSNGNDAKYVQGSVGDNANHSVREGDGVYNRDDARLPESIIRGNEEQWDFGKDRGPNQNIYGDRRLHENSSGVFGDQSIHSSRTGVSESQSSVIKYNEGIYSLQEQDIPSNSYSKSKILQNNINALKLLKQLEHTKKPASRKEQSLLAKYQGFGGLPQVFDENNDTYAKQREELKNLVTNEEYISLRDSTSDSFYTSKELVDSIYKIIDKAGFLDKKGLKILEPSCGSGHFFGFMPKSLQENSSIVGIELNPITAKISQYLYQNDNLQIINKPFQEVNLSEDKFDIVIGNFPFGNQVIHDQYSNFASGEKIHNYFLAKSIDRASDKGLIIAITSKEFLNSKDSLLKKHIDSKADFIGAFRLPQEAFKNSGTKALTDIVIFQKNDDKTFVQEKEEDISYTNWLYKEFISTNSYHNITLEQGFIQTIGTAEYMTNQYGREEIIITNKDTSKNFTEDLNLYIDKCIKNETFKKHIVQKNIMDNTPNIIENINIHEDIFVGELFVNENQIFKRISDKFELKRAEKLDLNIKQNQKLVKLIELKEIAKKIVDPSNDIPKNILKKDLNIIYDDFVKEYGLINSKSNKSLISKDIRKNIILSLEIMKNDEFQKAEIFTKDFNANTIDYNPTNISEACYFSVSEKGYLDINFIQKQMNYINNEEVISNIVKEDIAFYNQTNKSWELAETYLSGDIIEKIEELEKFELENEDTNNIDLTRNKKALQEALPKKISFHEIHFSLLTHWIPKEYKIEFIKHIVNDHPEKQDLRVKFDFDELTSSYSIDIFYELYSHGKYKNQTVFGNGKISAVEILTKIFKHQDIVIYDDVLVDGKYEKKVNAIETSLAQELKQKIENEFYNFITSNKERIKSVEDIYNYNYNRTAVTKYKDNIVLKHNDHNVELRPYQKRAVLRGILEGTYLLDHKVGAGKTFTMITTAQERKRMGLNKKPMFVVMKSTIDQWNKEIIKLYPNASIYVCDNKKDIVNIAFNDWDAVLISHDIFSSINLSSEFVIKELRDEIQLIEKSLSKLMSENRYSFSVKQLKKVKEAYQSRLSILYKESKKDKSLCFDNLGIDEIYVDEAHKFKNLHFHTKNSRIQGIPNTSSQRAFDLYLKCKYLQNKRNGKGVFFATGTPISNSLVEAFTMQRFLDGNSLKKAGLSHFDSWSNLFAKKEFVWEVGSTGRGINKSYKFTEFKNLPELSKMYLKFADVVTEKDLEKYVTLPKIEGGVQKNMIVPPTEQQEKFMDSLVKRMERLSEIKDPRKDNPLMITNEGRAGSVDMRILGDGYKQPSNKILIASKQIKELYKKWDKEKGVQLVFSDISVPKTDGSFSIYNDLKERLIDEGIKDDEIAFIHDYPKEKMEKLQEDVRVGNIRVLIGSTNKMGTGLNIQDILVGLHHLDVPWKPSELEQREGRILRQGNKLEKKYPHFRVRINRYATENMFDSRSWQIIENKQRFISQFSNGSLKVREAEDLGEGSIKTIEEMKALSNGNPYLLLSIRLNEELAKEKHKYNSSVINKANMKSELEDYNTGNHKDLNQVRKDLGILSEFKERLSEDKLNFSTYNYTNGVTKVIENNTNLVCVNTEDMLTKKQIENRIKKFKEKVPEDIKILEQKEIGIIRTIEAYSNYIKEEIDTSRLKSLEEDVDYCKSILEGDVKQEKLWLPKTKGFAKEIQNIKEILQLKHKKNNKKEISI